LSVLWVAYATHSRYKIPDAVDAVVCAPDDVWWYHPKHVEQLPDKINCNVAACWIYIGILLRCTDPWTLNFLMHFSSLRAYYTSRLILHFFGHDATAPVGQDLPIIEDSRSHSDIPHSIGLLWTSDQPDSEDCTWQNLSLTRERHPCPGGIRTHRLNKLAAADPRLTPRGHWDR
jgi:hypothetical protein